MNAQELMSQYIAEHSSGGEADPAAYLERADPAERLELAALIDAYLERAPRARFDDQAYRASRAPEMAQALERSIAGASGTWPALLPRLRAHAGLKRRELVERLAGALGQEGGKEKVAFYYHEMEQGLLPSEGVSDRVLEALARITGSTAQALREAGERLHPGPAPTAGGMAAFARAAHADADMAPLAAPAEREPGGEGRESGPSSPAGADPWDAVDDLFAGGQG